MAFTSNNILSLLMPYRGKPYIQTDVKKVYRWVSLLPDTWEEMESDMLYVCKLSEAMMRNRSGVNCHFVCVCDRYLSDEDRENADAMRNLILVEENRSVSWLLNLIQNRFLEIEEWEMKMKDVLLRDGGYQELMDVSEHYLKNALFVMDGAYRLVAHSKTYKSPDPINVSLYEKGYHVPETMQRFYQHKRFEEYFKNPGVVVCPPGRIAQFESLCQWCWHDGAPLIQIVEVFYNSPMSAESIELFELLMKYVNAYFRKEQLRSQTTGPAYGRFLRDLIYNNMTDVVLIAECAKRANIPMTGNFDAYRISFKDTGKVLVGRFVQELSELLPSSKIVSKDFEISILNIYAGSSVEKQSLLLAQKTVPLLEKYGAMLGVSAPFSVLTGFGHACEQASIALHYGNRCFRFTPPANTPNDAIFLYNNAHIYHLLELSTHGPFNFFRSNVYLKKIQELMDYDHEHNCDLADILYWFLYYERRSTDASKKLHMHRNTITYHIQHITDMLNLDLDDYMTRQQLMLTYHYLELTDSN